MFEPVKKLFEENNIDISYSLKEFSDEIRFYIMGPRNSIINYRIWGTEKNPIVDAWFGKYYSDSGGLMLQASGLVGNQLDIIFRLHKRYIISGRRKILRKYERKRLGL